MTKKEREEKKRVKVLLEEFVDYFLEVEIPHMKAMNKIWDKFHKAYKKLHPGE